MLRLGADDGDADDGVTDGFNDIECNIDGDIDCEGDDMGVGPGVVIVVGANDGSDDGSDDGISTGSIDCVGDDDRKFEGEGEPVDGDVDDDTDGSATGAKDSNICGGSDGEINIDGENDCHGVVSDSVTVADGDRDGMVVDGDGVGLDTGVPDGCDDIVIKVSVDGGLDPILSRGTLGEALTVGLDVGVIILINSGDNAGDIEGATETK